MRDIGRRILTQTLPSQSVDFFSESIAVQYYSNFSVQIITTLGSTFTATLILQVSNDNVTWVDYENSSEDIAGTTDSQIYDVESYTGYSRIKIDMTGGSAAFKFIWTLK